MGLVDSTRWSCLDAAVHELSLSVVLVLAGVPIAVLCVLLFLVVAACLD